jgi:hypothetical protein
MTPAAETSFNRKGLGLLIAAGLVFGVAFVLLSAFGPDLEAGRDGGAHAMSPAGTGYAALVDLARAGGLQARRGRDETAVRSAGLLVLTPALDTAPGEITKRVRERKGAPTLVILPKWLTRPLPYPQGWVESAATVPPDAAAALLRPLLPKLALADGAMPGGALLRDGDAPGLVLRAPKKPRTITAGLDPVLSDSAGHVLLGWSARDNVYVLAEPDLLNNKGLASLPAAEAAVRLLAVHGGRQPGGVVLDVTLNGLGIGQSLLRTAFEPPFLALTLALVIAGLLAAWHGLMRFGTPQPAPRAIPFGKLALVDNAAGLIRMAGREADMAPRYAALTAEAAASRLRAPLGLDAAGQAAWLAARGTGFAHLAHDAAAASTPEDALTAAKALYRWQETLAP